MVSKARLISAFLPYIQSLKSTYGLRIVETHVHPYDVIGVVHHGDYAEAWPGEFQYEKFAGKKRNKDREGLIGWLGKMDYNKYAFSLFNIALRIMPGYEKYDLRQAFRRTGVKRLLDEMDESLVDEAVLLPVEPWLPTEKVKKQLPHRRLRLLGSVDIHRLPVQDIGSTIKHFVDDFGIIGLKLHPNMQNFLPQPCHNPQDVEAKLAAIYRTADDLGLYLLFHGGPSGLARKLDKKYGVLTQKSRNGLLENFCDRAGCSELFGKYRIPIVIAHLGHFGTPKLNVPLVRTILDGYANVFFDTAATPSRFIQKFIEWGGSKRLLFGTDALYFPILYSMYSVYKAVRRARTGEDQDEIMVQILGKNFYTHIVKEGI